MAELMDTIGADLVSRLRMWHGATGAEAADEIEELRALLSHIEARLRETKEPAE